jgi:hypothetical protein
MLLILDASYAAGMEFLPAEILDRMDIMVCPDQAADWDPTSKVCRRAECGSILNVPRASSSVEAVVWLSGTLDADLAPFFILEILRILKVGGEMSFIGVGAAPSIDLRSALRLAKIAHNQSNIPSDAVGHFSLLKGERKADYDEFPRTRPNRPAPTRNPTGVKGRHCDPRL